MNFIEDIIKKDLKEGKVDSIYTRFPPEPNGYLHIGHAKSICLNYYGTAVKYGGKFNLRFDDTNPSTEDDEYVQSIIEDVKWLGVRWDKKLYASDYFDIMYQSAVKLIKKGKAYVDDITSEQMRALRGTLTQKGTNSPNRDRPKEESLQLFEDMKNGLVQDGTLVLRAKIDMDSPNMNMRDPIIYRVLHAHHHRQGDKWCIYPMYDFAHPIEDAVEKITHSICTLEFEDHRPLYDWVVQECEFDPAPHQYEFARLELTRTIMSKRLLKRLVDNGFVQGWDDPRMPTIAGLRRRGFTPSSIIEFCERIGVSKANSQVEVESLESCIRDELNITADRVMVVSDPIKMVITNRDNNFNEELDFQINPNNEEKGSRKISFSNEVYIEREDFKIDPPPKYHRLTPDGMVRLRNAYIIKCTGYETDKDGNVTLIKAEIIEGTKSGEVTNKVKVKGTIHWINAKDCKDIQLRLYDYLLDENESNDDFIQRLNQNSLQVLTGKAEEFLTQVDPFSTYQFMRLGYFVRDCKEESPVFNRIVSLKDSYKKK